MMSRTAKMLPSPLQCASPCARECVRHGAQAKSNVLSNIDFALAMCKSIRRRLQQMCHHDRRLIIDTIKFTVYEGVISVMQKINLYM